MHIYSGRNSPISPFLYSIRFGKEIRTVGYKSDTILCTVLNLQITSVGKYLHL